MDTVSKLPFRIQLKNTYWTEAVKEADQFFFSEEEAYGCEQSTLQIEENDEIELLFESEDTEARLYTDLLYGIPKMQGMAMDIEGRWYCSPSKEHFWLYRSNDSYMPLCVDIFLITVVCKGRTYYGTIEVKPKQMDISEWGIMKKELEEEVRGLAKQLVPRKRAAGTEHELGTAASTMPLSKFLIIKNNARQVTAAIADIAEHPRSQIVTDCNAASSGRGRPMDRETQRRYVKTGCREALQNVAVKTVSYDIPGNQMLKTMMALYEKTVEEFIFWMEGEDASFISSEIRQEAYKLRKISSLLKQKPWYQQLSHQAGNFMPHSFLMDTRYNAIYRLYNELRKNASSMPMPPAYSYSWKRSSLLYEMWCFIKVCQMLGAQYKLEEETWDSAFGGREECPVLQSGTTIRFYDDEVELYVQYDRTLPQSEQQTEEKDPLYMVKMLNGGIDHNKPDITIQMYSRKYGCYIGSQVIECKYRKMGSFWRMDSDRSSIGQLQTYFNNARSSYLYGGMGRRFNCSPVQQVIVLTPDISGNDVEQQDFNIIIKAMKPSSTGEMFAEVRGLLSENIKKAMDNCQFFFR